MFSCSRLASTTLIRSRGAARRWLTEKASTSVGKEEAAKAVAKEKVASATTAEAAAETKPTGLWHSAGFWGGLGAAAGWGMSLSAIYDSMNSGPEVISLTMTPVLMIYSGLFMRWAWIVQPRNVPLAACHLANVIAQTNQLRRALQHKMENGEKERVMELGKQAAVGGTVLAGCVAAGPRARSALTNANLGAISAIAAADAGPFTVHFWAPMSKWGISGASFFDLHRPTDQISLPQYTALTLTGFFFSRYSLLVTPVNYVLMSVNVALFGSSAWHLGRKVKADFIDEQPATAADDAAAESA